MSHFLIYYINMRRHDYFPFLIHWAADQRSRLLINLFLLDNSTLLLGVLSLKGWQTISKILSVVTLWCQPKRKSFENVILICHFLISLFGNTHSSHVFYPVQKTRLFEIHITSRLLFSQTSAISDLYFILLYIVSVRAQKIIRLGQNFWSPARAETRFTKEFVQPTAERYCE